MTTHASILISMENEMRIKNNYKFEEQAYGYYPYSFYNEGTLPLIKDVKTLLNNYYKNQRIKKVVEIWKHCVIIFVYEIFHIE